MTLQDLIRQHTATELGEMKSRLTQLEQFLAIEPRVRSPRAKTGRGTMSAAARKEVSKRMKKYWAAKRAAKKNEGK